MDVKKDVCANERQFLYIGICIHTTGIGSLVREYIESIDELEKATITFHSSSLSVSL